MGGRGAAASQWLARQTEGVFTTESLLFEMILPLFFLPLSNGYSLLRLCSSVQAPFLRAMSSTAISPILPRPRSPFRITWWTAGTCTISLLVTTSNFEVSCYTHTFQSRSPQRDLGVPPAVPARPSPHCWTVLLSFLHKHLQHAHVVACQLVPERQAQIAVVPGGREWKDQLGSSPRPFVTHLRDGEVSSTCCDGDWDQLLEQQQHSSGLNFSRDTHGGSSAPPPFKIHGELLAAAGAQIDFSMTATPVFLETLLKFQINFYKDYQNNLTYFCLLELFIQKWWRLLNALRNKTDYFPYNNFVVKYLQHVYS